MLEVGIIILFYSIAVFSFFKTKSVIYPVFLVSFIWATLLLLYNITDHDLFKLSNLFYYSISLWVISFFIGSFLTYPIKISYPSFLRNELPKIGFIQKILPLLILTNVYYFIRLYFLGGDLSIYALYLEESFENPIDVQFVAVLSKFSILISYSVIAFRLPIKKTILIILIITILAGLFIRGVRGNLFQYIVGLFIALYLGKRIKPIKLFLIVLVSSLCVLLLIRITRYSTDEEYDYERFFAVYAFSPLPAFDMVLNGELNYSEKKTFRYFQRYEKLLDENIKESSMLEDFVNVPLPTNVYTVMFSFFVDFGYYGILFFGLLFGVFWSFLFKGVQQKSAFFILLYSILAYSLIFQFFADYLFLQIHSILQFLFIICILCIRCKLFNLKF